MFETAETKSKVRSIGSGSVFVIDDDPEQCQEIGDYLRRKGHFVTEIHDGVTAITEIQKYQPSVALMDVHMPFCDGIRATELVNSLSPRTTVILMSGFPEEVVRARRADCGALTILTKPISLAEVSDLVSDLIA